MQRTPLHYSCEFVYESGETEQFDRGTSRLQNTRGFVPRAKKELKLALAMFLPIVLVRASASGKGRWRDGEGHRELQVYQE